MAISSAAALVFVTALAPRHGPGASQPWKRPARPSSCGGGRLREAHRSPFPRGPWLPRSLPDWLARWRPAVAPRAKCDACRAVRGPVARPRLRTARPPVSTHRPAWLASRQCAAGRSVLVARIPGAGAPWGANDLYSGDRRWRGPAIRPAPLRSCTVAAGLEALPQLA